MADVKKSMSGSKSRWYPVLALQRLAQIRFVGGVRSDVGSSFFRFAPPAIAFEGGEGSEQLFCEGERLTCDSASLLYSLPVAAVGRLRIEARRGDLPVARKNLSLVEPTGIPSREPSRFVDRFNRPLDNGAGPGIQRAHGPLVLPDRPPSSETSYVLPFHEEGRIHFVGRRAGEVWMWPNEPAPAGWTPVWAVTRGRRMRATYCGSSVDEDRPSAEGPSDAKRKKLWKTILWWDRKRTSQPPHPALQRLWKEYQEVARGVQ